MGRQVHFHMLPRDQSDFLHFVLEHDRVVVTLRNADSAEIQPVANLGDPNQPALCLWNRTLQEKLERKWIPDPGYYMVDGLHTPTLEFIPSFAATWEGKPALGQGRLFGDFDAYLGKPVEFQKWYETLVRWIRKNYQKNPAGGGGYVGPAAYEFYEQGAYLLSNFLPPETKEWSTKIGKQHSS